MVVPSMTIPPCPGTALGKDVTFQYKRDDDRDGTLILRWDDWEDYIHDREVIGVIYEPQERRPDEVQPQLILRIVTSQSSPESTKLRFSFEPLPVTALPLNYLNRHLLTKTPEHLFVPPNPDGARNLHVVVSTRSGVGEAQQYYSDFLKGFLAAVDLKPETYHVHITESDKSITNLVEQIIRPRANRGIAQTILLLSGDGGLVDTVNVLLLSEQSDAYVKPTVGLICMGTGNAMFNSTGLNRDASRGLTSLFRGGPHNLPTFTASFSSRAVFLTDEGRKTEPLPLEHGHGIVHGVVVCSWALHASLVADSDTTEYRKYGAQRFQMAAKQLMAPEDGAAPHVYSGKITLYKTDDQGEEHAEEIQDLNTSYIVATLVSNFEEQLTISPDSRPLDGQLRVLRFGDISGADVMRLIGMALRGGGHEKDSMAEYAPINGLKIEFDEADARWRRVCVDGKIIQVEEGGWVEVRKGKRDIVDLVA
ncbi:MAG: hypothetical protein L6R37_001059 [Teloschistes peruensis]|nr:MAG: hypothetical protein L6R37_001059 [Teloschistes peruensis]